MLRQTLAIIVLVSFLVFSGSTFADHHEAGQVKAAVKKFYSQMSAHDYKGALGHIALGGNGYVATGDLRTIDSEEARQGVVSMLEEGKEKGAEMSLQPRDIKVATHGDLAIATYMIDANVKGPQADASEEQVNRGTLVWTKMGDGWKIVHWHISEFEADEN